MSITSGFNLSESEADVAKREAENLRTQNHMLNERLERMERQMAEMGKERAQVVVVEELPNDTALFLPANWGMPTMSQGLLRERLIGNFRKSLRHSMDAKNSRTSYAIGTDTMILEQLLNQLERNILDYLDSVNFAGSVALVKFPSRSMEHTLEELLILKIKHEEGMDGLNVWRASLKDQKYPNTYESGFKQLAAFRHERGLLAAAQRYSGNDGGRGSGQQQGGGSAATVDRGGGRGGQTPKRQ